MGMWGVGGGYLLNILSMIEQVYMKLELWDNVNQIELK